MKQDTKTNLKIAFAAALILGTIGFASDADIRPLPASGVPDGCELISGGRTPAMKCN